MARRLLLSVVVVAWFAGIGLVSAPAPARDAALPLPGAATTQLTNDDCLVCHADAETTATEGENAGRSIAVDGPRFADSIHGLLGLDCTSCHTDLVDADLPHATTLQEVDCSGCHPDSVAAYDHSIHADARRQAADSVAATCVDCHTAHDIRPSSDQTSPTYALNLPQTCSRCHADPSVIATGHIAAGNVGAQFLDSIHGKAISKSGLLVAANCTSCHGAHDIRLKADAESRVFRTNIPSVCATCHEGIAAQFTRGSHGGALADGRGPVCTDCHSAHQIQRADVGSWKLDTVNECGTCHADKIKTYRDTFHGQVTSLGFVRVAKCSDCHGAHEVHPKTDPRSMVSPDRVVETCRTCHAGATEGFAAYDPHADHDDRDRNPELYYAAHFMHWLLIGVFGFFGLHAALWLPRSAAERRRRLTAAPPAPPQDTTS